MFGAAMASTFVLRPLRDQFGVDQGIERMPWLYGLTLAASLVFTPAFWWLANRMPSRRFVPIALHAAAAMMLLLVAALGVVGSYDWQAPGGSRVGEGFWAWFSAMNVAVPALVWIHTVEHFRRDQGKRLFGLIGVGGTLGALFGSWFARQLSAAALPPSSAALASACLLETAFVCYLASARACAAMGEGAAAGGPRIAGGGLLAGLRLLARDRHVAAIGVYTVVMGVVATAFSVAQTDLLGAQVASGRAQHGWLAWQEMMSQGLVLLLQLTCTGRALRRLPAALFLCLMPMLSIVGLSTVWLWPTAAVVAVVQILRRGAQFSFEKPAREVLYTPLDLEAKHKVKFMLDTFALRLGDLLGAITQVHLMRGSAALSLGGVVAATAAIALVWGVHGYRLGVRSERRAAT